MLLLKIKSFIEMSKVDEVVVVVDESSKLPQLMDRTSIIISS